MGMIGNYLRVSRSELEEYLNDSSKLEDRVYNEESQNDKNLIDVDKSWEGLFFLLTGASVENLDEAKEPLCWTLNTSQIIDPDQDLGYGPASYTTIEQTKEVSVALNKLTTDELRNRYDGNLMMKLGIYPEIWDEIESLEYLIENFKALKEFYNKAAVENQAVIIFVN